MTPSIWSLPAAFLSAVTLVVPAIAAGPEPSGISVDWNEPHQTIVGFGGTMGWIHPGERVREKVYDLLFTELGASVLRVRALGGEGGDELSIEPKNDDGDPDTFNWPAFPVYLTEAKNAAIIRAAVARGVRTVIPTSWSPPGWMKDTGRRANGGTLREDMLDEFAEAWTAYCVGMRREFGIEIRLLSIQNEPDLTHYYPTCEFTPELYARAVRAAQARLDREKTGVRVLGPDVCRVYNVPDYLAEMERAGYDRGGDTFDKLSVAVLSTRRSGQASKFTRRGGGGEGRTASPILTHLYDLAIPYEDTERDAERWREARDLARRHGRALWFMETANYLSYGVAAGSYEEALVWARKIHHALADGDCEVVCYWSLFFDKMGEALVYCAESGSNEFEVTPKFYSSMNYYRFVRPGMRRVTAASTDPELFVTAFAGKGDRVVVIVNWADAARHVGLPVPEGAAWERYVTSKTLSCERVPLATATPELPARSVTTLIRTAPASGANPSPGAPLDSAPPRHIVR